MGDKFHAGAVLVALAVPRIAEDGMAEHGKVAADLMQTSGLEGDFGHRGVSGRIIGDEGIAGKSGLVVQRQLRSPPAPG